MTDPNERELSDRRAKLDAALAARTSKTLETDAEGRSNKSGWGDAVKISSEFIAGILAGAGIGYLIDQIAGTTPWGLIVFLMLGFGAGILNVLRTTGRVAEPENRIADAASKDEMNDANGGGN